MLSGPTMIRAARHLLRRLGLVSVLLMTLAVVLPSAEAQACAPSPDQAVAAVVVLDADGCDAGLCGDCGAACTHGCCHAPHVAVPAAPVVALARDRVATPHLIADSAFVVAGTPDGPERPPRV